MCPFTILELNRLLLASNSFYPLIWQGICNYNDAIHEVRNQLTDMTIQKHGSTEIQAYKEPVIEQEEKGQKFINISNQSNNQGQPSRTVGTATVNALTS